MMATDDIDNLDISKILDISNIDDSWDITKSILGIYSKNDLIIDNVNLTPFARKKSVEDICNIFKQTILDLISKCNSLQEQCNELKDKCEELEEESQSLRETIFEVMTLPKLLTLKTNDDLIDSIKHIIKYINIRYPETSKEYTDIDLDTTDGLFDAAVLIKKHLKLTAPSEIKTTDDIYDTIIESCKIFNINYIN